MNCLECRREILACPNEPGVGAAAHLSGCKACRTFLAEAVELEGRIANALAVPVPVELAVRALGGARPGFASTRRSLVAFAAALLLVVASATGFWLTRDDPFARAGIDFVVDKEVGAILTAKPADPGVLARVVKALHVQLPRRATEVRYIGTCPFEGTIAHHVVVITPEGKATLLLFPERPIQAVGGASARGLRSVARPAGVGSVVIVGSSQAIRQFEDIVTRS